MSLFSQLLGTDKVRNPFQGQINNSTGALKGTEQGYSEFGQGAKGEYDWLSPMFHSALEKRVSTLNADPFTDSYSTAALGKATEGTTAAYNTARSNLNSDLSARGISTDSSAAIGGLTSIENARQGILGNAENNLAFQKIGQRNNQQDELMQLLSGVRTSAKGDFFGSMAGAGSIEQFLAQLYSSNGQQQQSAQSAQSGNISNLIGTLAASGAF